MVKIRIRKSDTLFSQYIREKANWKCEFCHKDYKDNPRALHASHYWSRGKEATRFDERNVVALCFYHHQKLGHGDGRDDYRDFMIKRLGQKEFDKLQVDSNTYKKRDDAMDLLYIQELLRELG